jgi:hypothetical protein
VANQSPHNFWSSLKVERDKAVFADEFYSNVFEVENIIRFDTESELDLDFQRADIDVQLHAWERHSNVSEKFRAIDYNDLYIELYSMYPNVKGWMQNSSADNLAYFFPTRLIWIDKKELIRAFETHVLSNINAAKIEELQTNYRQQNGSLTDEISINSSSHKVRYIKAYNKTKSKDWDTIGLSLPFDLLEAIGVKLKVYAL